MLYFNLLVCLPVRCEALLHSIVITSEESQEKLSLGSEINIHVLSEWELRLSYFRSHFPYLQSLTRIRRVRQKVLGNL